MTSLESPTLKTDKKRKNYKLNRNRGLGWEDELTKDLNCSRYMYCYNLGGSTHNIPDIVVFADNYVTDNSIKNKQLTLDNLITVNEKMITGPFVMVVECKYSTENKIIIPKDDIDKCFEFLGQLSRYERFVLLAFKFKNGYKPIKLFTLIRYDHIYVNTPYDFFMMDRSGLCGFYNKGVNQHKPPSFHPFLGSAYMSATNTRIYRGEFNLDSA